MSNVKIKYLEPSAEYWVVDIEADGLHDASRIWCIVCRNYISGATVRFTEDGVSEFVDWYKETQPVLVGHNLIGYDIPTINRILGVECDLSRCVDTYVLSCLSNPVIVGGHSLAAWGERLGFPKFEFNDWSQFSSEMLTYCEQDVNVTVELYKHLSQMKFSELSCWIEHEAARVINQQQRNGVYFDVQGATELRDQLRAKQADLEKSIHEVFPPKLCVAGVYKYREKSNGEPFASYIKHREKYPKLQFSRDGSKYRVFEYRPFNIGSPQQRVERLLEQGWKPTSFTPKGQPKVDEDSLVAFAEKSGNEAVKQMSEWLVCSARANMIDNWLNNVGPDSRLRGRVNSCGAGTRRMTHNTPNTANIPGNDAPYGALCRGFFTVPPDSNRVIVGADASGLEFRVMVHYLDNSEAEDYFLNGDAHTSNAEAVGYERRPTKNLFYAFLYGASDKKLGAMVGKGPKEGARIRDALVKNVPGLEDLVKSVQSEYQQNDGWLQTIDGGFVLCPSPHAALNYKFQSAGAIFMKRAAILMDEYARPYDALKVLDVHDEWQWDCYKPHAVQVGALMVRSMEEAGKLLGFKAPMTGEYKIGNSWRETH